MAAKIKKGDNVIVIAGRDKGKVGEVTRVLPKENKAFVQGVNMVRRHTRPTQTSEGGIIQKESTVDLSNLAILDGDNKPTRVGFRINEDGTKVRFAKSTGKEL